jgi:hypothetical protein
MWKPVCDLLSLPEELDGFIFMGLCIVWDMYCVGCVMCGLYNVWAV